MNRRCRDEASEQSPKDWPESMSSALKWSLQHRCIASEQWRQQPAEDSFSTGWTDAHRINRRHRTGLSGDTYVICQRTQWLPQGKEWPDEPVPYHRSIRRYAEKLGNGFQRFYPLGGLYICHSPGIWSLLELLQASNTPKNISKPSKCLLIISLILSTHLRVLVLG